MSEWISVVERMPTREGRYSVKIKLANKTYIALARYKKDVDNFNKSNITHWKELPELPI
jgi:hypothetical protein